MGKFTRIKYFIPSIILMIIIFSFSMQNGDESSGLSLMILNIIKQFIPIHNIELAHFLIRKAAHMSEYAMLSLSFIYAFYKCEYSRYCLYSLICTFLYACSDELHQLLVSGRAGQFSDVLIDTCGGLIMICLFIIVRRLRNGISSQTNQ